MAIRKRDVSQLETCGFLVHFLSLPLVIVYFLWSFTPEETLNDWQITYYPPQSYAVLVPTFLLCAFVAVLFLYGAINAMIVPKVHAIENLWDEHSRVFKPTVQDGRLPDICDIDVAVVNDALEKASRRSK